MNIVVKELVIYISKLRIDLVPFVPVAWSSFASLKKSLEEEPFQKHPIISPIRRSVSFYAYLVHESKLRSRMGIKKTSVKRWFSVVYSRERGTRTISCKPLKINN